LMVAMSIASQNMYLHNLAVQHGGVNWHLHCHCEVSWSVLEFYPLMGWCTPVTITIRWVVRQHLTWFSALLLGLLHLWGSPLRFYSQCLTWDVGLL
jgi:hypothetical protein